MKWVLLLLLFASQLASAQQKAACQDARFDDEVRRLLTLSINAIDVDTLLQIRDSVVILDAREKEEFQISHIPGARHIGYQHFDRRTLEHIPKDARIVVYCSIGVRSEKIAERIQKAGYGDVVNVYGSIFEWANRGYPLEDSHGHPTDQLHTYSRKWSQWVSANGIRKVW